MRKIVGVSVAVFLIMIAGGWCIAWYLQAQEAKKAIENAIAVLNRKETYITYDSIRTSGFPGDVSVELVRPRFAGRVDALLKDIVASTGPAAGTSLDQHKQMILDLPEWHEDITFQDRIVLSVNALSDRYALRIKGPVKELTTVDGRSFTMQSQPEGDVVCDVTFEHGAGLFGRLWSFAMLQKGGEPTVQEFRMLNCQAPVNTVVDTASGQKMFGSGPMELRAARAMPAAGQHTIEFALKAADVEFTPQFDALVDIFAKAMSSSPGKMSAYGKQTVAVDFAFSGPASGEIFSRDSPFSITLRQFDIINALYQARLKLHIENALSGDSRQGKLRLQSSLTVSDQYEAALQDFIRAGIDEALRSPAPEFAAFKEAVAKYTPEELFSIIYPAFPRIASLGTITQIIDLDFQGDKDWTSGGVNLSALEFSFTPYGITASGNVKNAPGQMSPAGTLKVQCANCLRMIDDATGYVGRLQKTLAYFDPARAESFKLDPRLVEGVKNFLVALAGPGNGAQPGTLSYTLVGDGGMNTTINDKPLDHLMQLYTQHLAPVVPRTEGALPPPGSR